MKLKLIYFVFLSATLFFGCNYIHKTPSNLESESLKNYLNYKQAFDSSLVKHFPKGFSSEIRSFSSLKDVTKQNIGFYLYEYDVNLSVLKKIRAKIEKNAIANYRTSDTLLFVINRFENLQTDDNGNIPKIRDSIYIDSTTFIGLYPIPNFIEYEKPTESKNSIWLPQGFDLYVLEAKSGNYFKEYDLKKNFQMPKGWKNGFSRGIAISEKDKTIIYWGVVW